MKAPPLPEINLASREKSEFFLRASGPPLDSDQFIKILPLLAASMPRLEQTYYLPLNVRLSDSATATAESLSGEWSNFETCVSIMAQSETGKWSQRGRTLDWLLIAGSRSRKPNDANYR